MAVQKFNFFLLQDMGTLSSETSDSVASNSELSGGSASGDDQTPSPIYKNQKQLPQSQPPNPGQSGERPSPTESQPQRKPPAYSRQFSAPHLQQKSTSTSTQSKLSSAHPQLLHSKSESPLTQVHAFQPTRPKVPPKPLDLERPHRAPLAQTEMRRSLDSGRIRRIFGQQGNPPLARAFSERLSGAPDHLARYHAARAASQQSLGQQPPQQAQIRPVPLSSTSEDQGKMENFYYEIAGPENLQGPPSYARHSYQNMRLDLEGNFRPAPHLEANKRPISRGHHQPQPLHHNQGGPRGERGPQLWSKEATRAWAAAHSQSHSFFHGHSHSHHHSQDGSTHHHHPSHHHPRRQTSSSVRLARSEMHPLPSSSIVPLALHQHQRNLHRSNRSASTDLASSQLHPYFENGKVCYRKPEEAPLSLSQPPQGKSLQPSQAHRPTSKDLSEPIYVNFPFPSPSTGAQNTKSWTSTDLDGDSPQDSEPLATPNDPPPPEDQRQSSPRLVPDQAGSTSVSLTPSTPDSPSAHNDSAATSPGSIQESDFLPASTSTGIHYRSHSDPQSSSCSTEPISGKEIASLLIEKLAEEERAEGPSTVTSSSASTSSSPAMEHPANPYPSQQHNQSPPAYNVYTPGPSRIRAPQRAGAGGFQRQDPLRRSSPGGQYRQAFDVMPSGDQVLKYYRTQNFTQGEHQSSGANPYPPRQHYQEPPYPIQSPQDPCSSGYPSQPLLEPSDTPSATFSNLTLGAPRPYPGQPGGLQYSQYPFQPGPMLGQYPNTPPRRDVVHEPVLRPQGLRNQRGLARQGSLPAPSPNWTIHTEGQTRSYC